MTSTRTDGPVSPETPFSWAGHAVDLASIERELGRAWREAALSGGIGQAPLATRTNVLNLIVHASSDEEVAHVARLIEQLGVHHPSRTLILLAQPDAPDDQLDAWIKTHVHDLPGTNRRLAFEQVTIAAKGAAAQSLPTIADPLLISELPNFLWWLNDPPFRTSLFTHMVDIVDRLIVDSTCFRNPDVGFHELSELSVIPEGVAVSDFGWGRMGPWRELIAQFFDPPALAPSLAALEAVEVRYEPTGPDGSSGLSMGILALGWLCSRLGWQVQPPTRREDGGAARWTLHAGGRAIDATLSPEHDEDGVGGLRSLTLAAGGDHPGTFRVYRDSTRHLATTVNVPGARQPDRLMRATLLEERDLLLHDLNQFGHDRLYEGALVFAAQLARGITTV